MCRYRKSENVFVTTLMGAFVILVRVSGGVNGFVTYLTEQGNKVRSKKMAMMIAYIIGVIIFIDGPFKYHVHRRCDKTADRQI